ncbi:transcription-repair coupling factor [Beggiatoa leptomitoformis]|uniref:Transcription-repair-coupling factor n=1 Tax=Beggiatoa leptomitoformis TaxID=288004 RepID=A0A2N9YJM0_9GAMM|nr:transcription-repair coupling factor [Beggiatoa leptomitoformis]ALG67334.1 transcription-repair coupling factor [Beggiatoa leptomitoformis]AUI70466.1 transcription-repair coupling factor [Beggiatoa leptomitoformis]
MSRLSPLHPALTVKTGQRQDWSGLQGSSIGLAISQVATAHAQPFIVITPDTLTMQRLVEEIQFYAPAHLHLLSFPDWETLPYDLFSPHQDIVSERLLTLYQLPDIEQGVLVLPMTTLLHRLPPKTYVRANSFLLKQGQHLNQEKLRQQLEQSGYHYVSQVAEHGEFTVRGGLCDFFPMGSDEPYRLEFFGDEIETIRTFDPETQRTQNTLTEVRLLPAREFPLDDEAITRFRTQWRTQFGGDPTRCPVYKDISNHIAPAGIEYYLPLFFNEVHTLFDYLPTNSIIMTLEGVLDTINQFWTDAQGRYEQLRHDIERPQLAPSHLFLQLNEVFAHIKDYPSIHLSATEQNKGLQFATQAPPALPIDARAHDPLTPLKNFLQTFHGKTLITAETTGRRESMLELFRRYAVKPQLVENWQDFLNSPHPLNLTIAPLTQGLLLAEESQPLTVISETQLFGERVAQRRLRKKAATQRDTDAIVRNLTELTIGAPVVHEQYGVGRYQGLVTLDISDMPAEFLHLEYDKQEKLYVPVAQLHLISRFTGTDPEHAPLHRLGSGQWEKARRKAAQQVRDVAVELLDIYAKRAIRSGHACKQDLVAYQGFAEGFPFEETPDQQEAIDAVLADMYAPKAMDRLVCGDVGFGKTEVAMRAAFIAVQDGLQVAVLVPTTLLAQQHYQNFQDRFADWAVQVEQLSRFRNKKQQEETLLAVADGKVDIVIGTHKLLQENIKFKQLGLVIIDEEHRFGVRQKEKFKALRAEVDVLTLTATPIPRSLNMALSNLRDLSIIATPPSRRLTIKTFVKEWHIPTLIEAIQRELRRGGQVYFLHNDIDSIENMANDIVNLVPEAQVRVAHGKMRERELERVMQDFYHRRFNVLVCTTIIETGIDVPTANTIIINRADKLGLAQLYQLRGRVGRSHHRAYAYLIAPPKKSMTPDAVKRLDAISALEELGMGFTLATHDLEIRGAGELLGDEQSGHIQEIGYSLYTELLERAIEALKAGKQPELERPLNTGTEINLHVSALIPNDYLPDVHSRLILYKRIANAPSAEALDEIQVEMIDRFGLLPDPAKALLQITELKLKATPLGIRKIDIGTEGGYLQFIENPPIEPLQVIQLVQKNPKQYRIDGQDKLRLLWSSPDFISRWTLLDKVLTQLIA